MSKKSKRELDNYNPTASLQLQNAAIFLRQWCKDFSTEPKAEKLRNATVAWLSVNKLQGDLKLPKGI